MAQACQPRERGEIGHVRCEYFEVFKLCAARQRGNIGQGVHRDDEDLKVGHALHKADAVYHLVVAEVDVLRLRAVFELVDLLVVEYAADGRARGEDALRVGADAVIRAEPDAPHHVDIRELLAYLLHAVVSQPRDDAAVVHVERSAPCERRERRDDRVAVIAYLGLAEVYGLVGEGEALAVEREGVVKIRLRTGLFQRGDLVPRQLAARLVAERDGGERGHAGEVWHQLRRGGGVDAGEVEGGGVERAVYAPGGEGVGEREIGVRRGQGLQRVRAEGGCAVPAAEVDRRHGGELRKRRYVCVERGAVDARKAHALGVVVHARTVRQGDIIGHVDLRVRLRPCDYLVRAVAPAEVRRAQRGEAVELFRLPVVQNDGEVGGIVFEGALLKGDGVRHRGGKVAQRDAPQP